MTTAIPADIPQIPDCIKIVSQSSEVYWDLHAISDKTVLSPVYGAFKKACALPIDPRGAELDWLMSNGTPAGKVFACFIAWELDFDAGLERFNSLLGDETTVNYRSGCFGFPTTLSNIATQFLNERKFHDFPSSNHTKLPQS